jgi:cell division ATPase FtsA
MKAISPNFFKKRPLSEKGKTEYFLALDIGTEAVKALVFEKSFSGKEERTVILGKSLDYFDRTRTFGMRRFDINAIKNAALGAIKSSDFRVLKNPSKISDQVILKSLPTLLSLSPNILMEKIVEESLERENSQKIIYKGESDSISQVIFKKTQEDISRIFSERLGILPDDIKLLDLEILETKIDGYDVSTVQGFNGKNLDFRICAKFSLKDYLNEIEKFVKEMNLNVVRILTESENLFHLLPEDKKDAIFLDVGGEVSQIFLAKNNKLEVISEFKNGGLNFTEKISQVLGLSLEDSRILKHNYSNAVLSEEVRKKVKEILAEEVKVWLQGFKEALKNIAEEKQVILPTDIFLFGGGSLLPDIDEILGMNDFKELPFISQPNVKLVSPEDIRNVEYKTKILTTRQDISPILICL